MAMSAVIDLEHLSQCVRYVIGRLEQFSGGRLRGGHPPDGVAQCCK